MKWKKTSKIIGRGSTATVSLAVSELSDELAAAKSTKNSLSEPLRREKSILSKLDSPFVVKYKGFEEDEESYSLFTEYHPLGTLSDEIRRLGLLEESAVRMYTCQILNGLDYLHSNGIVHCDIKSSNLLIGKKGLKISDLGCSRKSTDPLTFSGTPMYMSPEVVLGQRQGFESDIWSLGCTVVEMITGQNPWPKVNDPVSALYRIGFSGESLPEIPRILSKEGKEFLSTCFKRNPRERSTAKELLKHPFFNGLSSLGFDQNPNNKELSPTSVFDLQSVWDNNYWDSLDQFSSSSSLDSDSDHLAERIQRLIIGSSSSTSFNDDDEEDWITVRSNYNNNIIIINNESSDEEFSALRSDDDVNNYIIISPMISIITNSISGDNNIRKRRTSTLDFDECIVENDIVFSNYLINENIRSLHYFFPCLYLLGQMKVCLYS